MKRYFLLLLISLMAINTNSFAAGSHTQDEANHDTVANSADASATNSTSVVVKTSCENGSACSIVADTTKQVLDIINKNPLSEQTISTIQEIVVPKFDFTLMTKYALGANWKVATPKEQTQLVELFKKLLIRTYSSAISKFKGSQITIVSSEADEKKAAVISKVILPNSENNQAIKVEYNLAKLPNSRTWKTYDVKIENASLVTTYRNQFNDIIQSSKVEGLIHQLQTKIDSLQKNKAPHSNQG